MFRGTGLSWSQFIKDISSKEADPSLFMDEKGYFQVPNTILATALARADDRERRNQYANVLKKLTYPENPLLNKLVSAPFDAFLTTNYTYEIENVLNPRYLSAKTKNDYSGLLSGKRENGALMHTYNQVIPSGAPVWHIHGELRRRSSVILSHDEYARLIQKIVSYSREQLKNRCETDQTSFEVRSWVDYFMIADIHVLGYGFDFCEMDLWWLLSRRCRERASVGSIFFYQPESMAEIYKKRALEAVNVQYLSLSYTAHPNMSDDESSAFYRKFYSAAIDEIVNKVNQRKER